MTPEFIRLPEAGKKGDRPSCPHTGLSRTGLYNLTVACKANGFRPAVPAKCLRARGTTRGVWLIPFAKLMEYLNALPDSVNAADQFATAKSGVKEQVEAGQPSPVERAPGEGLASK